MENDDGGVRAALIHELGYLEDSYRLHMTMARADRNAIHRVKRALRIQLTPAKEKAVGGLLVVCTSKALVAKYLLAFLTLPLHQFFL